MQLPGAPSLALLVVLLALLPRAAARAARLAAERRSEGSVHQADAREAHWRRAFLGQAALLALAWWVGSGFGFEVFGGAELSLPNLGWAVLAFAACYAVRLVSRATRTRQELEHLVVFERAPRRPVELAWFAAAVLMASVAQEAAYRGVGWAILTYSLGAPWGGALILSVAFALAHRDQGRKSCVAVFVLALIQHGLVAGTGTLVYAMAVQATYNGVVGLQIRSRAMSDRTEIDATQ